MKPLYTLFSALLISLALAACTPQKPILWKVTPAGLPEHSTTVLGNPAPTSGRGGANAVKFDGVDDGLLINHNPLANVDELTVEVIFKPAAAGTSNQAQRLLQIGDPANPARHLYLEVRFTGNNQWYASFHLTSDNGETTLMEASKTHPVDQWATMTLVYRDKKATGYVNGLPEVNGTVDFLPLPATAKTSIGTSINQQSWFSGEIETVRFFQTALLPKKYSEGIPTTTK